MLRYMHRARWAAAIAAGLALPACQDFKNQLLQPQNPGIIDNCAVGSPAAAAALKVGAMGKIKVVYTSSETLWQEAGQVADEYQNADFQPDRNDVDQRTMATNSPYSNYQSVTQTRGYIRDALAAETKFEPTKTTDIGELWMSLGFIELSLGENFCNGIPLGNNTNGVVDYSSASFKPLTNTEVFDVADRPPRQRDHADRVGVRTRRASSCAAPRWCSRRACWSTRASTPPRPRSCPTSVVPTTWQYLFTTSTASTSDDNGIWTLNNSVSRVTVGDSTMTYQGKTFFIANAIPFFSLNDPRVPVVTGASQKLVAEDGLTPLYLQQIWKNRDDAVALAAGIDARMIEAEAKLNGGDIPGMMSILNAARAAPPRLGWRAAARRAAGAAGACHAGRGGQPVLPREGLLAILARLPAERHAPARSPVQADAGQGLPERTALQGRHVRLGRELPGAGRRAGESAVPRLHRSQRVRKPIL